MQSIWTKFADEKPQADRPIIFTEFVESDEVDGVRFHSAGLTLGVAREIGFGLVIYRDKGRGQFDQLSEFDHAALASASWAYQADLIRSIGPVDEIDNIFLDGDTPHEGRIQGELFIP